MKNQEDETQTQTIDYLFEEYKKQFEQIVYQCQAFNHCTYIINQYYKFKSGIHEQLRFTNNETKVLKYAISQLWKQLKQLDQESDEHPDISHMLMEYEEYRYPLKIQEIRQFKQHSPQKAVKQKTLKLCESWMLDGDLSSSTQKALNPQLDIIPEDNLKESVASQCLINEQEIQFKDPEEEQLDLLEIKMQEAISLYKEALLDESFAIVKQIFMNLNGKQSQWFKEKKYQEFYEDLEQKKRDLDVNLLVLDSGGWRIEKQSRHLTIKYKICEDTSTVTVYLDSIFKTDITKLMALINEIDLYHNYVPFCERSTTNKQLSRTCKICDIIVYFPFISNRRAVFVGEGIDRLNINGTIVFVCKSIDSDYEYQRKHDIHIEQNKNLISLIINYYIFELTPLPDNECRVRAITNSNPQVKYLPNWLIAYLARKMAYELFERMEKITKNFEKSPWFEKYQQNIDFYEWIDAKVKKYFDLRQK